MTPAEVLRGAAKYLREHGWVQRAGKDGGPRCAVGAIDSVYVASGGRIWRGGDAAGTARRVLSSSLGVVFVSQWNDAPGRTADEVIAKLEEVAAELEAKGGGL